ncbi:hypothetical protein Dsin_014214 [Dipteronia sinensis]|uniref:Uncharacterized protein n=1 Tax=Dipteronia sinensis TaxID=43782 RepID=A0AAE0AMN4_9ROSI|nr:hypothetical protein Dsin_014214 [Dipteronia sinensis]
MLLLNNLQRLDKRHSTVLAKLSPNARKKVDVLKQIQSERDELEKKYYEEISALEAKYEKLYEPYYSKRCEIVNGIVKVDDGDVTKEDGDKATKEKGVPNFWLTAMKFNDALAKEISKRDEGALKYLQDIKWCRIDDPKGFKLEFLFDPNPYFKNSVLTKTYPMSDDFVAIPEKAIGTPIEWYPGKCLSQELVEKKYGLWSAKSMETKDCESFFNFFKAPAPEDDGYDKDEGYRYGVEDDITICSIFRDEIIPRAISWFIGEAISIQMMREIQMNGAAAAAAAGAEAESQAIIVVVSRVLREKQR